MDSDWQEVSARIGFVCTAGDTLFLYYYTSIMLKHWGIFYGTPGLTFPTQIYQVQLPSPNVAQYGPIPNIGTLTFDTHQELLWVGDNFVRY